ncbi:MAG TPA: hypothetical protein VMS55_27945 [Myxococcota bacterium]|nr:hypothetical protein [Myxococcota bacterium]
MRRPFSMVLVGVLVGVCMWTTAGSASAGCTVTACTGAVGNAPYVDGDVSPPPSSGVISAEIQDENGNHLATGVVDPYGHFHVDAPLNSRKYKVVIQEDGGDVLCQGSFEVKDPASHATFVASGPVPIPIPSTQIFTPSSPVTITEDDGSAVVMPLAGTITVDFAFTPQPGIVQGTVSGLALTVPSFSIGPLQTGPNAIALRSPSTFALDLGSLSTVGGIRVHASNDLGEANFDGALNGDLNPITGVWHPMGSGAVCSVSDVGGTAIPGESAWALWTAAALILGTAYRLVQQQKRRSRAGAAA